MEIFPVEITRPRREFGRPINDPRASTVKLEDSPVKLLSEQWSDPSIKPVDVKVAAKLAGQWVERAVTTIELDCIPVLAQHTVLARLFALRTLYSRAVSCPKVSTETFTQASRGTSLTEGASDTKAPDADRGKKRKLKNEPGFAASVVCVFAHLCTASWASLLLDGIRSRW